MASVLAIEGRKPAPGRRPELGASKKGSTWPARPFIPGERPARGRSLRKRRSENPRSGKRPPEKKEPAPPCGGTGRISQRSRSLFKERAIDYARRRRAAARPARPRTAAAPGAGIWVKWRLHWVTAPVSPAALS